MGTQIIVKCACRGLRDVSLATTSVALFIRTNQLDVAIGGPAMDVFAAQGRGHQLGECSGVQANTGILSEAARPAGCGS